ncbi:MAG: SPOR domain-containing protein [Pseudomonadota bacterium]
MARDFAGGQAQAKSRSKSRSSSPALLGFLAGLMVGLALSSLVWLRSGHPPPLPAGLLKSSPPAKTDTPPPQASESPAKPAVNPPQFDFYNLLPEMEVVVPPPEGIGKMAKAPEPLPRPVEPTPPTPPLPKPDKSEHRNTEAAARVEARSPEIRTIPARTDNPPPSVVATRPAEPVKPPPPPRAEEPPAAPIKESFMLQIASYRSLEEADQMKARLAFLGVQVGIQRITVDNRDTFFRVRAGPYRDAKQTEEIRRRLSGDGISAVVIKLRG